MEKPRRRVRNHGYWIDVFPVTNDQYALFVTLTGRHPPDHWDGVAPDHCFETPDAGPDASPDADVDNPLPWECEGDRQTCDPTHPCPEGYWCHNGCCLVSPV